MAFLNETGLAYFWNQILARLNKFVPAESGKGLSSNDYTAEEKEKLAGIEVGANKTIVDSTLSATSTNPVQNKVINIAITNLNTLVGDALARKQDTLIQSGASIGQIAKITAVDESGKPTAWEASDFPEQIQSDYNQNDETAPDYVKNRPFYTGDPVENIFVEESTVSFAKTSYGYYDGQIQSTFVPTVGETYKVSWDGTDYECTCIENNGIPLLGDLNIIFGMHDPADEPFLISARDGKKLEIITVNSSASHTFSVVSRESVAQVVKINPKYLPISFKPLGGSYLTFSSANNFTISVNNLSKNWDGTLEYFTSDGAWTVWDGTKPLVANANEGEYALYLRGIKNTVIARSDNSSWFLNGTDIKCIGNIENLLDYATVKSGGHPNMSNSCYSYMFEGCTSLTQAPALPATTLADSCYIYMFEGCTSLTQAPALPATTLADSCYSRMFNNCTSLTQAPALPATTLADSCYNRMFNNCTSLTQAPALPATTLASFCYNSMFCGCTSLKLSSTKTDKYTQEYRIPSSGNGITATNALRDMFFSTGGTFTGTPDINTKYYLSSDNMIVRETDISTLNGYVGSMINNALPTALSDLSDDETHRTVTDEEKTAWSAKSNWNQNDETAADYVKNRPFYTGDAVESDPIDFIGATWSLEDGVYSAEYQGTGNFPLSVGNGAKLTVDGTEYTGTVEDLSAIAEGMIGFGDVEAVISGDPTAINFAVFGASHGDMIDLHVVIKADVEPTSCTVLGIMQEVKKIEPKYLPGSLLPDSASSGQMMKFKGYSWLPVPDPTEWEFIYGKPIVGGSTEIPCEIKKAYKKILVVAQRIKVSGTKALDIYVSTLPNPVGTYKFSGFCKIPLSAQPALEKSTVSFLIIEKLPFQGYLCFVNKTPYYNDGDSAQDSDVLITYNNRSKLVSQGETESTTLYFGITGDTFNGAGSLTLYGIPE